MFKDLHNDLKYELGFAPVVVTDNTVTSTGNIDLQDVNGVELVFITGTLADADATFTVAVTEGDDTSSMTAVADADLIGTEANASFTFADDSTTKKIGYRGKRRYIKASVTPANNSGNAPLGCVVVKGVRKLPQS